ncbi:TRAP transporter large permease [Actinobacteria bacterium YIM 96077]|uniref:TRAP transporter large permease n=1 Tax=Phytoactinopolyspora halophila TaxID=1981511 RepID=A0A329QJD5_9ACTN|nr:TRAP transporter large permease [Phytoactinopolyspora halophila]AYY12684.1 TRAP transporter large permease [Actinobacteria bacterium YIM 96077]RAW10598.1 TRAP transporter large permease [Phytoactinopolyspora halophila]
MTLLLMLAALIVLLMLRVPVAIALLTPGLVYVLVDGSASLELAVQQTLSGVNSFPILAVPMFILLGNLANVSGITDRVYGAAVAFLGHVRGSLGYVNVATSFGFSWMSGAAIADAAAMGRVQVPAMVKRGYSRSFSVGITGASSVIAPLIPPSIPAIIYAVTAGLSVGALFVTGILPALVLVVCLCVTVWWMTRAKEELRESRASWSVRGKELLAALPAAGAAVIILGGILGGIVTPTEASASGVLYIFLLALAYRALTWRKIYHVILQTVETAGSVLLIVAGAALFGWVLARERAPQAIADLILQVTNHPIIFLILVNVFLLVIGAVLEPTAAILIVVPVLAPVAETFGIHPMHFAAIVIFNLLLGLLTPPVGLLHFVLSGVTSTPVTTVIRGVMPFYVPMLVVLLVVTFVPAVSLWLPTLLGLA